MAFAGLKIYFAVALAVVAAAGGADGKMHHVVGGDRGWELATDLASWLDGRVFRVGDRIWFAYSVADGGIYEVGSREEYYSCDSTNPIKMYTDGLNSVHLTGEGTRYFVSSNSSSCGNGLKLHVEVLPQDLNDKATSSSNVAFDSVSDYVRAAGPNAPSGSPRVTGSFPLVVAGLGLWFMGL